MNQNYNDIKIKYIIIYIIHYCIGTFKNMSNPTVLSVSNSSDNAYATVTFSEDVFNNSDGTGDLTVSDFSVTAIVVITFDSIESVSKTSNSVYVLNYHFRVYQMVTKQY